MKTNVLLVAVAAVYGLAGAVLLFAPAETLTASGEPISAFSVWLVQAFGAALLGFAWLNWFHRFTRTRGILGRPVLMPNLAFASIVFWLSLGAWRRSPGGSAALAGIAVLFGILSMVIGATAFARAGSGTDPGSNP